MAFSQRTGSHHPVDPCGMAAGRRESLRFRSQPQVLRPQNRRIQSVTYRRQYEVRLSMESSIRGHQPLQFPQPIQHNLDLRRGVNRV
jgi:hypothetical protein